MNVLLVSPDFPSPRKSRNHNRFVPLGLLKLATYHQKKGDTIQLAKANELPFFRPDVIYVTSLFTYWAKYVWSAVEFYKNAYPSTKVIVGGIYASLMPEHCKKSGCDEVYVGLHSEAERCEPAYDLVDVDYQIVHTSRGCPRRCPFCGTYKIEPEFEYKKSIQDEVHCNKLIFYDNNLLANPYIENILLEIANLRKNGRVIHCQSQCGFDGRLLTPKIAALLKKARFKYPKIAWDGSFDSYEEIDSQLQILVNAGYRNSDISIFMIYNWDLTFQEMEEKRIQCWEWKVQINDCRYRPLNWTYDEYKPRRHQTIKDYYIHPKWTDEEIKQFRRNVRRQNICVRQRKSFFSKHLLYKKYSKDIEKSDKWFPGHPCSPQEDISAHDSSYWFLN